MKDKERLGITNLHHTPYSPDFNPIGDTWAILKARLRRHSRKLTSEEELWVAIQEEWEGVTIRTVNKLIVGMETEAQVGGH